MANVLDYLEWRGDLSIQAAPFNEVDNLILSQLVYVDFEGVVPGEDSEEEISLLEASRIFWEKQSCTQSRNTLNTAIPLGIWQRSPCWKKRPAAMFVIWKRPDNTPKRLSGRMSNGSRRRIRSIRLRADICNFLKFTSPWVIMSRR